MAPTGLKRPHLVLSASVPLWWGAVHGPEVPASSPVNKYMTVRVHDLAPSLLTWGKKDTSLLPGSNRPTQGSGALCAPKQHGQLTPAVLVISVMALDLRSTHVDGTAG